MTRACAPRLPVVWFAAVVAAVACDTGTKAKDETAVGETAPTEPVSLGKTAPTEPESPSKPDPVEPVAPSTTAEEDDDNDMGDVEAAPGEGEDELEYALGPLTLSMDASKVVELLGEPQKKGEVISMSSVNWQQEWAYSDKGLVLTMSSSSEAGDQALTAITAEAPCELKTPLGVAVGDAFDEAKRKYERFAAPASDQSDEFFLAGSFHGGVILHKGEDEHGKPIVSSIFVGSAAG